MENLTAAAFENSLCKKIDELYSLTPEAASDENIYRAVSLIVRDMLERKLRHRDARAFGEGAKQVSYLSMEFLVGRSLKNNLYNLGINETVKEVLAKHGISLERIYDQEPDAGLGNGGLGRLAACYMDGLATCDYPATGYSILYEYGIFRQKLTDGWQQETLDNWLAEGGDVWLDEKRDEAVEVRFAGTIVERWDGAYHHVDHIGGSTVRAVPYDMYIPGYDSRSVSRLRLWKAESVGIDMDSISRGDFSSAIRGSGNAELISKVLYPNDNNLEGKILRLKQQYFFCSASINDMVSRHLAQYGALESLPDRLAVQLNDTHPTLAIPELMRILLDECGYTWEGAMDICRKVFSYTNHTVLSEALEKWDADMFRSLLPRIYQIVEEMDRRLRGELEQRFPGDIGKISYMAIIGDGKIRMANLCNYVCHSINGVSRLHSDIIRDEVFHDFYLFSPQKFTNVTNGIAYRRWLLQSNPGLTELLCETIGESFKKDAARLVDFAKYADDPSVQQRLAAIKLENKQRLVKYAQKNGVKYPINTDSIFDVQAKRMHEYKRQHLNALHIVHQYLQLKANPDMDFVPRTYIFGAKAAPGYYIAKQMIRLICGLQRLLENDEQVRDKLRVIYLEDYRVTLSELLMPAAEISEQISLAGTEASGTGNMKLMLSGALTLGTLDGANVEIRKLCGEENFFLFGMTKEQVLEFKAHGYCPEDYYNSNVDVRAAMDFISSGFGGNNYNELANNMLHQDPYFVLAEFESYREAQARAAQAYLDPAKWNRMSAMNIAQSGYFSADRAVTDYARDIWHMTPVK